MRCFVAIDIDQQVRDEIKNLVDELKDAINSRSGEMKWVRPDAIHLTLKFIDEVKDKDVPMLCEVVERVAQKYEHFHLELEEVGAFGSPPKVIWVGIKDVDDILAKMAAELEEELFKVGFAKEGRKFTPHLTICRIKSLKAARNAEDVLQDYEDFEGPDLPVEAVCVYQSELTEKGPVYTQLCKTGLK